MKKIGMLVLGLFLSSVPLAMADEAPATSDNSVIIDNSVTDNEPSNADNPPAEPSSNADTGSVMVQ